MAGAWAFELGWVTLVRNPDTIPHDGSVRLREYLALLQSRRWLVVLMVAAVVAATVLFSLQQTPLYESQAEVLVKPLDASTTATQVLPPNLETERKLVTSQAIAERAARQLESDEEPRDLLENLSVSVATSTEILEIRYVDPAPETAQRGAQAFADGYLSYRRDQVIDDIEATSKAIQRRISGRSNRLAEINEEIESLETNDPESEELVDLESDAAALETQIAVLQQEAIDATPSDLAVGRIVGPAALPLEPSSPDYVRNILIALVLGLALGVGLVFLLDRLDDRLRGREDLEMRLAAPVLALIPRAASWRRPKKAVLVTLADPHSPATEAYKTLRTAVQHVALQRDAKVFLITSALAGEGKSATTANLGVALAQAGKRTMLVSGDLRRPRLHEFFDGVADPGLTDVLERDMNPWSVTLKPSASDNLHLLPSGDMVPNPAELLERDEMTRLLSALRDTSDFVLVDSAPLLPVADAVTLAALADGVIFVADVETSTRSAVEGAVKQLRHVDAVVVGAVLNNLDTAGRGYYGDYAYEGYAPQPASRRSRKAPGHRLIRR